MDKPNIAFWSVKVIKLMYFRWFALTTMEWNWTKLLMIPIVVSRMSGTSSTSTHQLELTADAVSVCLDRINIKASKTSGWLVVMWWWWALKTLPQKIYYSSTTYCVYSCLTFFFCCARYFSPTWSLLYNYFSWLKKNKWKTAVHTYLQYKNKIRLNYGRGGQVKCLPTIFH